MALLPSTNDRINFQVHRAPKKKLCDLGGLRLDERARRFPSKLKLNLEINPVISAWKEPWKYAACMIAFTQEKRRYRGERRSAMHVVYIHTGD